MVGLRNHIFKLETALWRLGSMEAFEISRGVNPVQDAELIARIEYARKAVGKTT
jgi:hypothetical protein